MENQEGYKKLRRHRLATSVAAGLWLGRRTPSPAEQYDCPTLPLPHTVWPIFHGNLGSVPRGWGGFATAPSSLMPKRAACLHIHCLHIRAGLTDWSKTCSESNQAFLASRRPRSRCADAILHVHNIDLCTPVYLDMWWTCWIVCKCMAQQQQLCYALILEQPCMHDLVAQTLSILSGDSHVACLLNKAVDHR